MCSVVAYMAVSSVTVVRDAAFVRAAAASSVRCSQRRPTSLMMKTSFVRSAVVVTVVSSFSPCRRPDVDEIPA